MLGLGERVGGVELYFKAVPFHVYLQASHVLSNSVLTGTADKVKKQPSFAELVGKQTPQKTTKYSENRRL